MDPGSRRESTTSPNSTIPVRRGHPREPTGRPISRQRLTGIPCSQRAIGRVDSADTSGAEASCSTPRAPRAGVRWTGVSKSSSGWPRQRRLRQPPVVAHVERPGRSPPCRPPRPSSPSASWVMPSSAWTSGRIPSSRKPSSDERDHPRRGTPSCATARAPGSPPAAGTGRCPPGRRPGARSRPEARLRDVAGEDPAVVAVPVDRARVGRHAVLLAGPAAPG